LPSAGYRSTFAVESPAAASFRWRCAAAAAKPGEPWTRWNRESSRTVSSVAAPSTCARIADGVASGQNAIARSSPLAAAAAMKTAAAPKALFTKPP
jgi:hypothetical protein